MPCFFGEITFISSYQHLNVHAKTPTHKVMTSSEWCTWWPVKDEVGSCMIMKGLATFPRASGQTSLKHFTARLEKNSIEHVVYQFGYRLVPKELSLEAYKM